MWESRWPVASIDVDFSHSSTGGGITASASGTFTLTRVSVVDYMAAGGVLHELCSTETATGAGLSVGEFVLVHWGTHQCCADCDARVQVNLPVTLSAVGSVTTGTGTYDIDATLLAYDIIPVAVRENIRLLDYAPFVSAGSATVTITEVVAASASANCEITLIADPSPDDTSVGEVDYTWTTPDGFEVAISATRTTPGASGVYFEGWTGSFSITSSPADIPPPTSDDIQLTTEPNGIRLAGIGRYARTALDLPVEDNNSALRGNFVPLMSYEGVSHVEILLEAPDDPDGWTHGIEIDIPMSTPCPRDYSGGPETVGDDEVTVTWA